MMAKLILQALCFISTVLSQSKTSTGTQCRVQPFCSLIGDCCQAHSECYSICCGVTGSCVEPKYCYSNLKQNANLIS